MNASQSLLASLSKLLVLKLNLSCPQNPQATARYGEAISKNRVAKSGAALAAPVDPVVRSICPGGWHNPQLQAA